MTKHREDLLTEYPNLKDFLPLLDQLNKESHRGAVVLACSFIEDQLRNIIGAFLVEESGAEALLEGFNAPLGTLAARAAMAVSLGLIAKSEYTEITILKKIRNRFAHNFNASFEDQDIMDLCKNLTFSAQNYSEVVVGSFGKFNTVAVGLILNLTNRPHYVNKEKLTEQKWPY